VALKDKRGENVEWGYVTVFEGAVCKLREIS
jgi:hypothetical protein